jgi:hypothetical protein
MEGATLPVLAAPQPLAAVGAVPATATAAGDAGDGFAAILGATDLTHLTPAQRTALGQLLSDPAGTLAAGADAAGTILPQAAIGGLLQALGIGADPDSAQGDGAPFAGRRAAGDEAQAMPGAGPAVTALLGLLLPAGTTAAPPRPTTPAGTAEDATRLAQLASLAAGVRGGGLPEAADAASGGEGKGESRRGHPLGALLQMIRAAGRAGSAYGTATAGSAGVPGTGETLPSEAALPPGLLAMLEARAPADAVERTDGADLARGLATALEATQGGAGRAGLGAAAEGQTARPGGPVSTAVAVPFGERGWERAFGERVVWLVGQQLQAAEVRLNPPHLGPVEVRLSLTGQEANLSFTVAHGATRDAIEQAIPRLRELFADQQLQIVNVDVGQRDASSQASTGDRWGRAGEAPSEPRGRSGPADAEPTARPRVGGLPGLVDEYA